MKEITVEELKARVDNGEQLTVIDVREPAEYTEYNLGGKLMPLGQIIGMQLDEIEDMRNEELIFHCKGGTRSMQVCMVLEQIGFTNVVNVKGGAMAWKQQYGDAKIK